MESASSRGPPSAAPMGGMSRRAQQWVESFWSALRDEGGGTVTYGDDGEHCDPPTTTRRHIGGEEEDGEAEADEEGALDEDHKEEEEEDDLDDDTREFQTAMYSILESVMVPLPMEASMLRAVEAPIVQGFVWPKLTTASFVELVAAMCDASVDGGLWARRARGLLDRLFTDKGLYQYKHIRNRLLSMRVECELRRARLAPALTTNPLRLPEEEGEGGGEVSGDGGDSHAQRRSSLSMRIGSSGVHAELRLIEVVVEPLGGIKKMMRQQGGSFEPALAAVLVRDHKTVQVRRVSDTGVPVRVCVCTCMCVCVCVLCVCVCGPTTTVFHLLTVTSLTLLYRVLSLSLSPDDD